MPFILLQLFNNITEGPGNESTATYTAEIAIMLVVSFLLGFLFKLLLGKGSKKETKDIEIPVKKAEAVITPKNENFAKSSGNSVEIGRLKSDLAEANARIASLSAKPDNAATVETLHKEVNLKTTEIVSLKSEITNLKSELESCTISKNSLLAKVTAVKRDDLKRIEGIGPKIQQLLYDAGINTFSDLAVTPQEKIKEILLGAGERYVVHDYSTWGKQASLASENRWDELKQFQERLDSSKKNI